jgi:MFS family permease
LNSNQTSILSRDSHYKWLVVLMLWLVCFLNYADRQAISSVLPLLRESFGFQAVELGLIASAFAWVYAGAAPVAGVSADWLPRRYLIIVACLVWSVFTLMTAWCDGLWSLVSARALTGFGEAFYFPAAMALLSDYHDRQTRSRALAIHQSAVYAGTILGGWLAAELAQHSGWQTPFRLFGPGGILVAIMLIFWLREPRRGAAENGQFQGGPALSLMDTCRVIVRLPVAWLLMGAFFCSNFVAVIFLTWTPEFLVEKFHYAVGGAGLTGTIFIHLASAFSVLFAGWLADFLSRRWPGGRMLVQLIGLVVGSGFVFWVATANTRLALILAMVGFGACKGFYDSGIFASLYDCVEPRARGTAAGLMNTVGWFGGALGPLFVGIVTKYGSRPTMTENMSDAIAFGSIIYLTAAGCVLFALVLFRRRKI